MRVLFLIITFFFLLARLYAQVDTSAFQNNLYNILEDATTDKEGVEYYDLVEYLLQNKISINTASINDLMKIPNLDRQTATLIIRHRNLTGGIFSKDQFKNIEGVSTDVIDKILPFIQFGDTEGLTFFDTISKKMEQINISFRSRGIKDLQEEKAFKDGKYYGSSWKIYNRLIISKDKNIRLGVLTEKDPGEKSLNDLTTFHLYARDIGIVKSIVLGDYLFEFGQGLALWSRYTISKGIETVRILPRNARGLIPYLSTDENLFLRGGAVQLSYSDLNFYTFYSVKNLDGSINPITNQITSLRLDGLHRDSSEAANKKIITEKLLGVSIDYSFGGIGGIGLLYSTSIFRNDFEKQSPLDPSGSKFNYFSGGYDFNYGKLNFSGETAYNKKSFATINSAEISVDKNFSLLFSYRNYPANYWGLHANGFGEKYITQNETGFYSGLKLRTSYGTFYFYFDQFKYPFTSDKLPMASKGSEFLFYYTSKIFHNFEFRIRYTNQTKDVTDVVNDEYGFVKNRIEKVRGELLYKVSKNVQLRSRLEYLDVSLLSNKNNEIGFLVYQDVKYLPVPALNISARIIFFKTDSYNSRVYEFENDLAGVLTNPALYLEGMRWYFLIHYTMPIGISLSLKYSELYKPYERTMGSGDTEINSNVDNRLSFQLDFQF
ncbi:MAG: helix-hairpin-helix domain-containing protein [Bacteroidota bacterium]